MAGIGLKAFKLGLLASTLTTPASLFKLGEVGVWYDPSDLTTVFQDSAGTVPGAVDQPVGMIKDKSGNGKHATQSVAANRPILRKSGAYYYLEFDGTNDFLVTSSINFSGTDKVGIWAGVHKTNDTAYKTIVELSAAPTSTIGTFGLGASSLNGDASRRTWTSLLSGSAVNNIGGASIYAAAITSVLTAQFDISQSTAANESKLYVNDTLTTQTFNLADAGTGNFSNNPLYIGMRGGTLAPLAGRLYGLIIRAGLTDQKTLSFMTKWMNSKTGAY